MDLNQFKKIKESLEGHGYNNIDQENIYEKVMEFQAKRRLNPDGIVGPYTLWELQFESALEAPKIGLKKVEVDKWGGSYKVFMVREDIADALEAVYKKMNSLGSILPSSGGLRYLDQKGTKGRSPTSFHYTGLAIDMFIWSGLQDLKKDPMVLTLDDDQKHFHVYARATSEAVPEKTLECSVFKKNKLITKEIKGRFYSVTKLMRENGFTPIGIYDKFFISPSRFYILSEWWHFQNNTVLTESVSQFGIELLKIYGIEELRKRAVWKHKKAVFEGNGFYKFPKKYLKKS